MSACGARRRSKQAAGASNASSKASSKSSTVQQATDERARSEVKLEASAREAQLEREQEVAARRFEFAQAEAAWKKELSAAKEVAQRRVGECEAEKRVLASEVERVIAQLLTLLLALLAATRC